MTGSRWASHLFLAWLLSLLLASGCAVPQSSLLDSLPTYQGPRKIVAVVGFDNATNYGGDRFGELASQMLVTSLRRSERFVLVERERLDLVLQEQAWGQTGALDSDTRSQVGRVLGAQWLILGTITEFGFRDSELHVPLREALETAAQIAEMVEGKEGSGTAGGRRTGKGRKDKEGAAEALRTAAALSPEEFHYRKVDTRVVVEVRVVEAKSGRIVWAQRAEGGDRGLLVRVRSGQEEAGGGLLYDQTTASKTLRRAIERCVYELALATKGSPWEGRVARISGNKIFVTGGRDAGMGIGSQVEILRREGGAIDPETGEELEIAEERVGRGEVVRVEEHYSVVEVKEGSGLSFNDLVRLVAR